MNIRRQRYTVAAITVLRDNARDAIAARDYERAFALRQRARALARTLSRHV